MSFDDKAKAPDDKTLASALRTAKDLETMRALAAIKMAS